jgi:hypothetical protein
MRLAQGRSVLVASLFLLVVGNALAQYEVGIPVPNWTVPPYDGARPAGGLSTMADISPGIAFVAMSPCRVFDTRNANGPYGGPRLLANTTRNFDIDNGPCTGIPTGVDAYSMNFGAILPDGANSFVTIWPTGTAQPVVSSINPIQGGVVANAAIVPAGTNGSISVFPNTGVHLYGDINGYFSDRMGGTTQFEVRSAGGVAVFGENTASGYGVWGISANGFGVVGGGGAGGVWATTSGAIASGVYGQHTGSGIGVFGRALAVTGAGKGVYGETASTSPDSAGVFGTAGGLVSTVLGTVAGVHGESAEGIGVLGLTSDGLSGWAVYGHIGGGTGIAGALGLENGDIDYGVYSFGPARVTGNLTVDGNFSSANKWFVEPHPHDASKEIRYVSLEGPHAEVYFRGTAQISRGVTRIEIPQDFRFVADPSTYSTLVTPMGAMATVAVMSQGEEGIVVQASRDVKVAYVVYAERQAIKNPDPIAENEHFRPQRDHDVFKSMPESYRKLLVQNGTLNPDGTLNMETARRLGWDKEWRKPEKPVSQPTPE